MTVRICLSCAATSVETPFAPKVPGQKAPKECIACTTALLGQPVPVPTALARPRKVVTRASYRARHRRREQSPQMDLVDLLVPPP